MEDIIRENDLAIALAMARQLLGIDGDGTAHIWLDCIAETQWEENKGNARMSLLCDYIGHEKQSEFELYCNGLPMADCERC